MVVVIHSAEIYMNAYKQTTKTLHLTNGETYINRNMCINGFFILHFYIFRWFWPIRRKIRKKKITFYVEAITQNVKKINILR